MRQFIVDKQPDSHGLVQITGKDYRYLRQVLRVVAGDMINVRTSDGVLHNSTVAKVDEGSRTVTLQLCADTGNTAVNGNRENKADSITRGVQADSIQAEVASNGFEFTLFQFIPKPQKLELIVRQATECGIKNIVPVIGEYSEKSSVEALLGSKKERLERIIREARQQSGSPVDTKFLEPVTLAEAVEKYPQEAAFVLSERQTEQKSIKAILDEKRKENPDLRKIGIACGSEGGISPAEIDYLVQKGLFYTIHFSVNILRCETAALYGIAAVQVSLEK